MKERKLTLLDRAVRKYKQEGFLPLVKGAFLRSKTRLLKSSYQYLPFLIDLYTPHVETANVEPTNACNLRCQMCFSRDQRIDGVGYMSRKLFRKSVDEFGDLHADMLLVHYGGESLLHPDFTEFLEYAVDNRNNSGIRGVGWIDNGTLFKDDVANLVVDLGVDFIQFSLDGLGKVNGEIRVGSRYEIIERNIMHLLERRAYRKKPVISINTVNVGKTEKQLEDFMKVWVPRVDYVIFSPLVSTEWKIADYGAYYGNHKLKVAPYCYSPFNYMVVTWNGKVTTCCADLGGRINLGNANTENLKDIWNGPRYRKMRRQCLHDNFPSELMCQTCTFWKNEFVPAKETVLDGTAVLYYESIKKKFQRSGVENDP